jgi:glyoxylase I family protein
MQPAGLHHVSINVRDVSAARDFYVKVLGLTERADRPDFSFDGAWLNAGSQQIHLIKADVPPDRGQHFALAVTDLDAAVAELRDRGITATDPVPVGTGRQSFLSDPAGNRIELQEPGA